MAGTESHEGSFFWRAERTSYSHGLDAELITLGVALSSSYGCARCMGVDKEVYRLSVLKELLRKRVQRNGGDRQQPPDLGDVAEM